MGGQTEAVDDNAFVLVRKNTFLEFVSVSRHSGVDMQCRRRSASGPPAVGDWAGPRTLKLREAHKLSTASHVAEHGTSMALAKVDITAATSQQIEQAAVPYAALQERARKAIAIAFRTGASLSSSSTDAGADSDRKSEPSSDEMDAPIRSTLMLGNLPNNYSRDMLLELIDSHGFVGQYNFFYLPIDFSTQASLGYAFINFVSAAQAQHFWARFDGFSRWSMPTKKICKVSWSHPLQGLEANMERYRNSPVMHKSVPDVYKPVRFEKGIRIPMPPPTKIIKVPRIKGFKGVYNRRFN